MLKALKDVEEEERQQQQNQEQQQQSSDSSQRWSKPTSWVDRVEVVTVNHNLNRKGRLIEWWWC